jgi:hypothetical protein
MTADASVLRSALRPALLVFGYLWYAWALRRHFRSDQTVMFTLGAVLSFLASAALFGSADQGAPGLLLVFWIILEFAICATALALVVRSFIQPGDKPSGR